MAPCLATARNVGHLRFGRGLIGAFLVALSLAQPSLAPAQSTGILLGIVGDTAHKPLPLAEVLAIHSRKNATTDARGIFGLVLPPGDEILLVRRVGYLPQTFEATIVAGDTLKIGVILGAAPATTLPDLMVEAEGVVYHGRMAEFAHRMQTSGAPRSSFVTRKEIDAQPAARVFDLLVHAGMKPRVDRRGRSTVVCPRGTSFNAPRTSFFIDGLKMNDSFDFNSLNVLDIEAIEVYRSAAERPAEFNLIGYDCTVVIWLRGSS